MPNWCECDLYVTGRDGRVREFLEFAAGDIPFDFNRFVPYPAEFEAMDREAKRRRQSDDPAVRAEGWTDGYNSGGYEWCLAHWGTKWNACRGRCGSTVSDGDVLTAALHFDTAWSPPTPVVENAAGRFPDLTFDLRFFERGVQFQGRFRCVGGEVVEHDVAEYFGHRGG